jgi:hypothetical protein
MSGGDYYVNVYGFAPGDRAEVAVTVLGSSDGVNTQTAIYLLTGFALQPALQPSFGSVTRTADGFTFQITNFNPDWFWHSVPESGNSSIDHSGLVTISGLSAGSSTSVRISSGRSGYVMGSSTIQGQALSAANPLILGTPTPLSDGFEVSITNCPANATIFTSLTDANVNPTSYSSQGSNCQIRFTGLANGRSVTLHVYGRLQDGTSLPTTSMNYTVVAPAPVAVVNPVAIPSAGSAFVTWGISPTATLYTVTAAPGGATCASAQNFCTINGLTNGTSYTFSIVASNNGSNSPAAVTESVRIGSQLEVSGALTSTTWKVGASVIANPLIVGQYSVLRYSWFRCDQAVPVTAAPPACTQLSETTNTYVLQAADVGKYITANLSVTGGAGQVQATLSNAVAALAANASSVPIDPNGKPLVLDIPNKEVPAVSGGRITINGSGFTGVTSVTVDGVVATIISATDTTLVISIPAAKSVGLVDLAITTPKGTATVASALAYTGTPVTTSPGTSTPGTSTPGTNVTPAKKKTLTAFAGSTITLSSKQKTEIAAFVIANPTLTKLSCAGLTDGVKKNAAEVKSATARAKAACSYAASLKGSLFTATKGGQGKLSGKVAKTVTLTFSN